MSNVFGAPPANQPTGGSWPAPPIEAGPLPSLLQLAAGMLGINPIQFATAVAANPEGAADVLDGAGLPPPDAAGGAEPAALGEALIGSEGIDYADDPTVQMQGGAGVDLAPPPTVAPTGSDQLTVPAPGSMGAPAPTPDTLAQVLSGVQPPKPPMAPQLGTPGVPSPRSIEGPTLDSLIRGALGVSAPSASNINLATATRR